MNPEPVNAYTNGNRANLLVDVLVDKVLKFGVNDTGWSYCLGSCLTVWTCAVRFRFCCSIKLYIHRKERRDIDFHILNFTRPEGGGCIAIRRRPITQ